MSIHKFGYEMIKKKGQYWVNGHLNWGGGGLGFFNNEKMLSLELEYKINLSYGCEKILVHAVLSTGYMTPPQ